MIKYLLLSTFGIHSILGKKDNFSTLVITKYDSLKRFHDEIGFIIKRKQEALKQSLNSYKRKGLRRYTLEFKLNAVKLLNNGLRHKEIAKILGTSPTNIYDWEKHLIL